MSAPDSSPNSSDTHAKASTWRGIAMRLGIIGTVWTLVCLGHDHLAEWCSGMGPCHWQQIMGFPCPGCHGTRAALALFRGDILGSLRNNFWPGIFAMATLIWALFPRTAQRLYMWAERHWFISLALLLTLWGIQWIRNIFVWHQGV